MIWWKKPTLTPIKTLLSDGIQLLERHAQKEMTGISSGFQELDKLTGGFQKGAFIILAGSPYMGKTALALKILASAALNQRKTVAFFSSESDPTLLAHRLLCTEAKVNLRLLGKNRDICDLTRVSATTQKLCAANIFLETGSCFSLSDIRSKCAYLKKQKGLDLIIVDDAQWIPKTNTVNAKQKKILHNSYALKMLADEFQIPVIAISGLNRSAEKRYGGRPRLSDIPESGSIAEYADMVLLLFRDEIYHKTAEKGSAKLILAKHNDGVTGEIPLVYFAEYAAFTDYTAQAMESAAGVSVAKTGIEQFAREEALRLGHGFVSTEHLLLGLIRENGGAAQALVNLGIDTQDLGNEIEQIIPLHNGKAAIARKIPLLPRVEQAMIQALMESITITGDPEFGSEYVLSALLRDRKSPAAILLSGKGVTVEKIVARR